MIVDLATRTDIIMLPLKCDPPPSGGAFEPRLRHFEAGGQPIIPKIDLR